MNASADVAVARIAAAIGEPARARMLYCLADGHARTSTELAIVSEVSPSTASAHLARLKEERLVVMLAQGKHRYYRLNGQDVAAVLEALSVVAGPAPGAFVPTTPNRLRAARTCYDHMAGALAVAIHDRLVTRRWIVADLADPQSYDVTSAGADALGSTGIDLNATRSLRRRFAFACLDWSERRPHLGGAVGAAILAKALERRWVVQDLDTRALSVTSVGRRELQARFGVSDAVRAAGPSTPRAKA